MWETNRYTLKNSREVGGSPRSSRMNCGGSGVLNLAIEPAAKERPSCASHYQSLPATLCAFIFAHIIIAQKSRPPRRKDLCFP
jgi:hypothetical protein